MYNAAVKILYRLFLPVLSLWVLAACNTPVADHPTAAVANPVVQNQSGACVYDRARLLALDMTPFDQNPDGGWRALAQQEGCLGTAADLIRDYHAAMPEKSYLLYWHEGQVRAMNGDSVSATQLFEKSHNGTDDTFGWNLYVDATVAFMKQDRTALVKAYLALANLPVPPNAQLDQNGNSLADSWPPNMKVVENLVACFGQEYKQAYQNCKS